MHLGQGAIEYVESLALLLSGSYTKALDILDADISKTTQKGAVLYPEYMTKAMILNYLGDYQDAYDIIMKEIYSKISEQNKDIKIPPLYNARILTQLAWAKSQTGRLNDSIKHSEQAVQILFKTQGYKDTKELYNCRDTFLASAIMVRAIVLNLNGQHDEGMELYKITKNIYINAYGLKNLGNIDQVGYMLLQAVRDSRKTKLQTANKNCMEYYRLLLKYFGETNKRTRDAKAICIQE